MPSVTTYFPFTPRPRASFFFQPVLDGAARQAEVRWSLFGRRWYVTVSTLTGTRIFTLPVVGSSDPDAVDGAVWDGTRERVAVATTAPHDVPVGTVARLTFRGFTPDTFNGVVDCVALDATTLAYAMPTDPGAVVVCGTAAFEVDLASGYFATSRLVYRTSSSRFEVDP